MELLKLEDGAAWEEICCLPAPRWGLVCEAIGENLLLVCGGMVGSESAPTRTCIGLFEASDAHTTPTAFSWESYPSMVRELASTISSVLMVCIVFSIENFTSTGVWCGGRTEDGSGWW